MPTFAIMMVPMMIGVGIAIDYTQLAKNRGKMINAADAAILAAAVEVKKLSDLSDVDAVKSKLKTEMEAFLKANTVGMREPTFKIDDIKYDPDTQGVELKVAYSFDTSFMKIAGLDEIEGAVDTAVFIDQDEQQSLSMYLVLDRSGSMGWTSGHWQRYWNGWRWSWRYVSTGSPRMTSLKKAVNELHKTFEEKDPDHKYVRTGGAAYHSRLQGTAKMDWGSAHTNRFAQRLRAGGGTQAYTALSRAHYYLKGDKEEKEHAKKNSGKPNKYILYMTDGADHRDSWARNHCDRAKKDNIQIYSVAFQAPAQGQRLLEYCASSKDHYFKAENANDLIAIFKEIGEKAARQLAIAK